MYTARGHAIDGNALMNDPRIFTLVLCSARAHSNYHSNYYVSRELRHPQEVFSNFIIIVVAPRFYHTINTIGKDTWVYSNCDFDACSVRNFFFNTYVTSA